MALESKFSVVEQILLTLWIGGVWAIGYIAVPILFTVLVDRHMAGELASSMFSAISYIGLICGALLLTGMFYSEGRQCIGSWRCWIIMVMLVLIVIMQFVLHPVMDEIRAQGLVEGSDLAKRFGQLHGISSILFMIMSLMGLILVIFGLHRKETAI
jgi:Domain of unknown function (DUF4149)